MLTVILSPTRIASVLVVPIAAQIGEAMEVPHPRLLILATAFICSAGMVRCITWLDSRVAHAFRLRMRTGSARFRFPQLAGDQRRGRHGRALPSAQGLLHSRDPSVYRGDGRRDYGRVRDHARVGSVNGGRE